MVKVNDRGPFHPGRIIDLSYTAAVRLGVYEKGSARVEVEAIDPASNITAPRTETPPAPAPASAPGEDDPLNQLLKSIESGTDQNPPDPGLPFIELGAFRKMGDCLQLKDTLKSHNLLALQVQARADSNECRVLQGPFATRKDAGAQLQSLRDLGYQPVITYP